MVMRVFQSGSKRFKNFTASARLFARDEDGGVFTIFVLTGFLIILCLGGMGVDMMHFERDRANLQATLDRAVLAAADLDQELPPGDVVKEYFEKSGVRGKLTKEPEVVAGFGSRRVKADAEVTVHTAFMYLAGIPKLHAEVSSTAEESVGSIEISMVLDMSGSMGEPSAEAGKTKIQVLREAAKKFVAAMYAKENPDKISISIVPYATQVSAGENILGKFVNATSEHSYSHCVNFTTSQFSERGISPSTSLSRTAHFDPFTSRSGSDLRTVCPTRAGSDITPVTNVISDLNDQIDALTASGRTSIEIGMKWGAALVDPEIRPIIQQLSRQKVDPTSTAVDAKTIVPKTFDNRPMDYNADVQKIIIVMTDGQNTAQPVLRADLRDGPSDVWYNPATEWTEWYYSSRYGWRTRNRSGDEYSVLSSESPQEYYWTRQERNGNDHRYGDLDDEQGTATRLSYPELFNQVSLYWNARYNYEWDSNYYNDWYANAFSEIYSGTKDTRTASICSKIKEQKKVKIYGIAFEAPAHGLTTIQNCASGPAFVYEVNSNGNLGEENLTLEQAFKSIASSIKRLRLTQ